MRRPMSSPSRLPALLSPHYSPPAMARREDGATLRAYRLSRNGSPLSQIEAHAAYAGFRRMTQDDQRRRVELYA